MPQPQQACKSGYGHSIFPEWRAGHPHPGGCVQVVAQHGNVDAVFLKQMPQIQRIAGGQALGVQGSPKDLLRATWAQVKPFWRTSGSTCSTGSAYVMQTQANWIMENSSSFPAQHAGLH